MLFLKIGTLLIMFVLASWGSGKLLQLYGYPLPTSFKSRQNWLIFAMKLIIFMILVIFQIIVLMLLGFNPMDVTGL